MFAEGVGYPSDVHRCCITNGAELPLQKDHQSQVCLPGFSLLTTLKDIVDPSSLIRRPPFSVMRISEVGVLSRIRERMLPGMPRCEALTTFHSARLADVYSAFVILVTGVISALTLGIFERVWSQRKSIRRKLKRAVGHRREGQDPGPSTTRKKFDAFVAGFSNGESDDNDRSLPIRENLTGFGTEEGERDIASRMRVHNGSDYPGYNLKPSNYSGVKLVSPRRRRNVDESARDNGDRETRMDQMFPFND